MKTCIYCGREGDGSQTFCKECGTLLTEPDPRLEPKPPSDFTFLRQAFMFAAVAIFAMFAYFMSFGPALRLFASAPITATTSNGLVLSTMVFQKMPAWMNIVYYPVLSGIMDFEPYRSYLHRWNKPAVEVTPAAWSNLTGLSPNFGSPGQTVK